MKVKRFYLSFFAFLDLVLFIQLLPYLNLSKSSFGLPFWILLISVFHSLFLISLLFSAIGLVLKKQWGFVLSYFQFPLRFVYYSFSFKFIASLLPLHIKNGKQIFIFIFLGSLECVRLGLTIYLQKQSTKSD